MVCKVKYNNTSNALYFVFLTLIYFSKMNIAILSRGPGLYSTQSLLHTGLRKGHHVRVLDHMRCNIVIEQDIPQIYYGNQVLTNVDAIIPRIGASVTFYGAAIVRQFELMDVFTVTSSDGLLRSRDKLRCLQLLSTAGLGMPKTVFSDHSGSAEDLIRAVGGCPVVIKLLSGTHGMGVVLAGTKQEAVSIIDAVQNHFHSYQLVKTSFARNTWLNSLRAQVEVTKSASNVADALVPDWRQPLSSFDH